jgi:hypothetical protein
MTKYRKNIKTNETVEDQGNLGSFYYTKDWILTSEPEKPKLTYKQKRLAEYGDVAKQIEFITENGLVAWKKKVEAIKTKHPKN